MYEYRYVGDAAKTFSLSLVLLIPIARALGVIGSGSRQFSNCRNSGTRYAQPLRIEHTLMMVEMIRDKNATQAFGAMMAMMLQ
jgi:hypothetical protein